MARASTACVTRCVALLAAMNVTAARAQDTHADAVGFAEVGGESAGLGAAPGAGSNDDAGFGDVQNGPSTAAFEADEPSALSLGLSLRLESALRLTHATPSRVATLRQIVGVHAEYKIDLGAGARLRLRAAARSEVDFAYLLDRERYDRATYDVYAWQVLPGETYVAFDYGALQLSFGKQIVNFGQADMLSLLDLINPRDLREPLLIDADDVRIPVLMTRASLGFERLRFEIVGVHEPYFGLLPPPLGEFNPLRNLQLESPAFGTALEGRTLVNEHVPAHEFTDWGATQVHGRIVWMAPGVDLALLAASVLDGLGVPSLPDPAAFAAQTIPLTISHPRYQMLGHSGAWTLGSFMLRWEVVFDIDRPLIVRRTDTELLMWSSVRRDALRGLVGITWAPSTTTSTALEVVQSHVFDNPGDSPASQQSPLFPVELPQLAFRFNQRCFSERLRINLMLLVIGVAPWNAAAGRIDVAYSPRDRLEISIGYVHYQPSHDFGYFYGFERNNRVFLNLRWEIQE
jgi:hypothetical protein